jgi:protein SCO1/2
MDAIADVETIQPETSKTYSSSLVNYKIPEIELLRGDGVLTSFESDINDGRPVILNFIYTSCAAICPLSSNIMRKVQTSLGEQFKDVHMTSISIDPEFDTPEKLMEYSKKFHAEKNWQFYTGKVKAIKSLQTAFNAYRGDKMNHSSTFFLRLSPNDHWLRIDGFASADELIQELKRLTIANKSL